MSRQNRQETGENTSEKIWFASQTCFFPLSLPGIVLCRLPLDLINLRPTPAQALASFRVYLCHTNRRVLSNPLLHSRRVFTGRDKHRDNFFEAMPPANVRRHPHVDLQLIFFRFPFLIDFNSTSFLPLKIPGHLDFFGRCLAHVCNSQELQTVPGAADNPILFSPEGSLSQTRSESQLSVTNATHKLTFSRFELSAKRFEFYSVRRQLQIASWWEHRKPDRCQIDRLCPSILASPAEKPCTSGKRKDSRASASLLISTLVSLRAAFHSHCTCQSIAKLQPEPEPGLSQASRASTQSPSAPIISPLLRLPDWALPTQFCFISPTTAPRGPSLCLCLCHCGALRPGFVGDHRPSWPRLSSNFDRSILCQAHERKALFFEQWSKVGKSDFSSLLQLSSPHIPSAVDTNWLQRETLSWFKKTTLSIE